VAWTIPQSLNSAPTARRRWCLTQHVIPAAVAAWFVAHLLVISLFSASAKPLSYGFLILMPLLAAAACLVCARQARTALNWSALATGLLLWSAGMAATAGMDLFVPASGDAAALPTLLYVLYGVPLTFIAASPAEDFWPARLIDAALALVLGGLLFGAIFTFSTLSGASDTSKLLLILDVQNLFILLFNFVRYRAGDTPAERDFFRAATLFSAIYLLAAGYINHFETNTEYGGPSDLAIDIPFLVMVVLASRRFSGPLKTRVPLASPRLSLIVRTASPLMFPLTLFALSCVLVFYKPWLAVAGFVIALIGYAARNVLVQVRINADRNRLEHLTQTDALTELANRRHFDDTLAREVRRTVRSGQPLSLLMVDIDHFKMLNDTYGHPEGDRYLRRVSRALTVCASRAGDLVARYGGEEFTIILPGLDTEAARLVAQRTLSAVVGLALPSPSTFGIVTVSIGVATADSLTDAVSLLAAADSALYRAKTSGRNRVVAHADSLPAA